MAVGTGQTIVEFLSFAISVSVCRSRSGIDCGCVARCRAASTSFAAA
jgi:hypothetical protein